MVNGLSLLFPSKFTAKIEEYATRDEYKEWVTQYNSSVGAPSHTSSPLVWTSNETQENQLTLVGGHDDTLKWCRQFMAPPSTSNSATSVTHSNDVVASDHGFDYDVIVIGGGSGGLACSKEMAKLGAKVAVLDFVKPSTQGSTWGLGGTCVNVGCIPKKLFHTAALVREHIESGESFGWTSSQLGTHDWETLRANIQDHIKGLNFGYRVSLREASVTYLNKLGKFVGPNTLEVTDKKGKVSEITASRFVVAVGGRPSKLECPGGELAISSDDLFSLEKSPGKTCVVGAGYVALECAGFISGVGLDATVCVRSIPLRGFDREIVDYAVKEMERHGTKFMTGILPKSIVKQADGKLHVTFTDGLMQEFDTVMVATGRYADTASLGLDTIGAKTNAKNGKLICVNEQTTVPNVYAIGDVVDDAPELTPVAIQAGKLLAKRLYGNSTTPMVYKNVATAIFTPLEIGTVGLSEEDARQEFGVETVDCYVSEFAPLEWSIDHRESREAAASFAKVIFNKEDDTVLGMHIASPNAGEIIQGFALAFRKGMKYSDLTDTVGIHPIIAEEFTMMSVTKSSGDSVAKTGC
jgi:thioredoxin reductase (NADPH)